MKNCETCKHWEKWDKDDFPFKQGIGECHMVVMFWDATTWGDADQDYQRIIEPKFKDQKAFVQDGSDYTASLYTRKDFGCVSHQEGTYAAYK